jgi:perosamine synthetase
MRYRFTLAAPDLSGHELQYVTQCVRSTWISSNGTFVKEFEEKVAAFTNTQHAVATCNGTVALHLALAALGIGPGDEVIVPSLTYVATANSVAYCGATPVFADSFADTWCLSPESVERMITKRTRAIICVHLYGHPCDMDGLRQVADRHGLLLIEDAAEALGARYKGRPAGSLSKAAIFSFFGNKVVTTGEGGMIVTDDAELAAYMRLLRGQGVDPNRSYWHVVRGFNYRMTNLAAAIGVAQMERIAEFLHHRRQVAEWYREAFHGCSNLTLPIEHPDCHNIFWLYSVLLEDARDRDPLIAALAGHGVESRPIFYPNHELPMYRGSVTDNGCPVAQSVAARGISLPSHCYLQREHVREIADIVLDSLSKLGRRAA